MTEPVKENKRLPLYGRLLTGLLFAILTAKLVHAAVVLSPHFDEYKHSQTGFAYLAYGVCCWGPSDTAMVGIHGWPWVLRDRMPISRVKEGQPIDYVEEGDRYPAVHRLNTESRYASIALCLLLAFLVFLLARDLGGPWAGVLALALFVASPNMQAHGFLVSTDFHGAFGIFFGVYVFYRCVLAGMTRRGAVLAGLGLGVALISKYTALALFGAFPIIALAALPGSSLTFVRAVLWTTSVFLIGLAFVFAVYEIPAWFGGLGIETPNPPPWKYPTGYYYGFALPRAMAAQGVASYFNGEFGTTWKSFYPTILALKTPLGLLALAVAGLVALRRWGDSWLGRAVVLVTPALIFFPSCLSKVTYALRYILPVWPFLMVLGGLAVLLPLAKTKVGRSIIVALLLWAFVSGNRDHPYQLCYVNELVGGPREASSWFVDSNLDWGQGLSALCDEVRERKIDHLFLSYHGSISPDLYGVRRAAPGVEGPLWSPLPPRTPVKGWVAVSLTHRVGLYVPRPPDKDPEAFTWLDAHEPVAIVGGSILLYHITP